MKIVKSFPFSVEAFTVFEMNAFVVASGILAIESAWVSHSNRQETNIHFEPLPEIKLLLLSEFAIENRSSQNIKKIIVKIIAKIPIYYEYILIQMMYLL